MKRQNLENQARPDDGIDWEADAEMRPPNIRKNIPSESWSLLPHDTYILSAIHELMRSVVENQNSEIHLPRRFFGFLFRP